MLKEKAGPCFLPINLYLSLFIYLWSRGQFEYIFTFAESSVVLCGRQWVPVISASFECFFFVSVFKLINFTCSSSNYVDLIKRFILIFIELKVKGIHCLSFFLSFFFFFCESEVG